MKFRPSVRDERKAAVPIGPATEIDGPVIRPERQDSMKFGKDFFKTLNIVIQMMRMFAKLFGDPEDAEAAAESEARTVDGDASHSC